MQIGDELVSFAENRGIAEGKVLEMEERHGNEG